MSAAVLSGPGQGGPTDAPTVAAVPLGSSGMGPYSIPTPYADANVPLLSLLARHRAAVPHREPITAQSSPGRTAAVGLTPFSQYFTAGRRIWPPLPTGQSGGSFELDAGASSSNGSGPRQRCGPGGADGPTVADAYSSSPRVGSWLQTVVAAVGDRQPRSSSPRSGSDFSGRDMKVRNSLKQSDPNPGQPTAPVSARCASSPRGRCSSVNTLSGFASAPEPSFRSKMDELHRRFEEQMEVHRELDRAWQQTVGLQEHLNALQAEHRTREVAMRLSKHHRDQLLSRLTQPQTGGLSLAELAGTHTTGAIAASPGASAAPHHSVTIVLSDGEIATRVARVGSTDGAAASRRSAAEAHGAGCRKKRDVSRDPPMPRTNATIVVEGSSIVGEGVPYARTRYTRRLTATSSLSDKGSSRSRNGDAVEDAQAMGSDVGTGRLPSSAVYSEDFASELPTATSSRSDFATVDVDERSGDSTGSVAHTASELVSDREVADGDQAATSDSVASENLRSTTGESLVSFSTTSSMASRRQRRQRSGSSTPQASFGDSSVSERNLQSAPVDLTTRSTAQMIALLQRTCQTVDAFLQRYGGHVPEAVPRKGAERGERGIVALENAGTASTSASGKPQLLREARETELLRNLVDHLRSSVIALAAVRQARRAKVRLLKNAAMLARIRQELQRDTALRLRDFLPSSKSGRHGRRHTGRKALALAKLLLGEGGAFTPTSASSTFRGSSVDERSQKHSGRKARQQDNRVQKKSARSVRRSSSLSVSFDDEMMGSGRRRGSRSGSADEIEDDFPVSDRGSLNQESLSLSIDDAFSIDHSRRGSLAVSSSIPDDFSIDGDARGGDSGTDDRVSYEFGSETTDQGGRSGSTSVLDDMESLPSTEDLSEEISLDDLELDPGAKLTREERRLAEALAELASSDELLDEDFLLATESVVTSPSPGTSSIPVEESLSASSSSVGMEIRSSGSRAESETASRAYSASFDSDLSAEAGPTNADAKVRPSASKEKAMRRLRRLLQSYLEHNPTASDGTSASSARSVQPATPAAESANSPLSMPSSTSKSDDPQPLGSPSLTPHASNGGAVSSDGLGTAKTNSSLSSAGAVEGHQLTAPKRRTASSRDMVERLAVDMGMTAERRREALHSVKPLTFSQLYSPTASATTSSSGTSIPSDAAMPDAQKIAGAYTSLVRDSRSRGSSTSPRTLSSSSSKASTTTAAIDMTAQEDPLHPSGPFVPTQPELSGEKSVVHLSDVHDKGDPCDAHPTSDAAGEGVSWVASGREQLVVTEPVKQPAPTDRLVAHVAWGIEAGLLWKSKQKAIIRELNRAPVQLPDASRATARGVHSAALRTQSEVAVSAAELPSSAVKHEIASRRVSSISYVASNEASATASSQAASGGNFGSRPLSRTTSDSAAAVEPEKTASDDAAKDFAYHWGMLESLLETRFRAREWGTEALASTDASASIDGTLDSCSSTAGSAAGATPGSTGPSSRPTDTAPSSASSSVSGT